MTVKKSNASPPAPPSETKVALEPLSPLGFWLFIFYLILYGGFMGLSAFATRLIAREVFAGINLAIVYGVGLILAAIALALLYMFAGGKRAGGGPGEESR